MHALPGYGRLADIDVTRCGEGIKHSPGSARVAIHALAKS
jgi:S-adenosylmethionine/arginine decarboxylase-like enzyme